MSLLVFFDYGLLQPVAAHFGDCEQVHFAKGWAVLRNDTKTAMSGLRALAGILCLAVVLTVSAGSTSRAEGETPAPRFAEWTIEVQFDEATHKNADGIILDETRKSSFIDSSTSSSRAAWTSSRDGKYEDFGCENTPGDRYTEEYAGSGSGTTEFVDAMEVSEPWYLNQWGLPDGDYVMFDVRPLGYIEVGYTITTCYNDTSTTTSPEETFLYGPVILPGTYASFDAAPQGTVLQLTYSKSVGTDADGSVIDATVVATKGPPLFKWSMPAMARDGNGDGRIDKYIDGNRSADVPADGRYDVRLDACSGPVPSQYRYIWNMVGPGGLTRTATHDRCAGTVRLEEGPWTITLKTKRSESEVAVKQGNDKIKVRNHLVVSLGDSYASGEGNPDGTIHVEGRPDKPKWMNRDCHRSAKAASALAAVELEQATNKSSVTFIHLACSGGTIPKGLIGSYDGAEDDGRSPRPQLTHARDLVNGQKPDAVVISIGGNDAAFAGIIETCIKWLNCWRQEADIEGKTGRLHSVSQQLLRRLTGRYAALRFCFESGRLCSLSGVVAEKPLKVPARKIIHLGYPDLTKGQSGQYCDDIISTSGAGIRADEYEWADKVVLSGQDNTTAVLTEKGDKQLPLTEDGLNPQIAGMAAHGWKPVLGHYADFRTHGYCADDKSWIRSLSQSERMQNNEKGAFHPNGKGHLNMATHLLPTLEQVLAVP